MLTGMNFNIVVGTNPRYSWDPLGDIVYFLARALVACGHRVSVSDIFISHSATNIFIDRIDGQPDLVRDILQKQLSYAIIFTEHVDDEGRINWGGVDPHMGEHSIGLKQADFVWCLLKASVEPVRRINPRTWYIPFGYVKGMATDYRLPRAERDIDFLVSGLCSERRMSILGELGRRGFRTYCSDMAPDYVRVGLLARSNVNLSVGKFDGYALVSVTRVCHSIINRIPVVLETDEPESEYAAFCLVASREHLLDDATLFLRQCDLEEFADEMLQMFMTRDMAATVEQLLSYVPGR